MTDLIWPGLHANEAAVINDVGFEFQRWLDDDRATVTAFLGQGHKFSTESERAERVTEWHAILEDVDAEAV